MTSRREESADCILCGKCLEVCPLLAATGREELSPRAKAHLSALLERNQKVATEIETSKLLELCINCGQCKKICSQNLDVPDMVSRMREAHPGWKAWLWKQWMTRAKAVWPAAGTIAARMPDAGPERLSTLVKMAASLGREPMTPFIEMEGVDVPRSEALLFPGCSATFAAPYWTSTAQSLCSSLNVSLIEAEFACCGAGLQAAGLRKEREDAARRNLDIWRAGDRPRVITLCTSCHAGLAGYADDNALLPDQREAEAWKSALTPLSALASDLLNSARFVVSPDAPEAIVHHRPCHLHGADHDERFLRAMLKGRDSGQDITLSDACCGFGGIMQLGAPHLPKQVNDRCWQVMDPEPAALVLTGCTACVFQLAATAPKGIKVAHWLECLKIT